MNIVPFHQVLCWILVFPLMLLEGCSSFIHPNFTSNETGLYQPKNQAEENLLTRYAPIFRVRDINKTYNRIGTPVATLAEKGDYLVKVETEQATVFTMIQPFDTTYSQYTNLIYRVHFPETPLPHLTSGKNVGLLVYITLDSSDKPVLITTLHTCGCYLAFIPTSNLPDKFYPEGWIKTEQNVFGEILPGVISLSEDSTKFIFDIRGETHRVSGVRNVATGDDNHVYQNISYVMKSMDELNHLRANDGETVSFFETKGLRQGHVRGSRKPLEMLLMSWWAMDPFIGEDKALGPPEATGATLYTTLKFWDRARSNIWFFPKFLNYWGWKL